MWPYDQTNRTAFPSLDEEVRGEANGPSRRASSAPWGHPGTRVLCLVAYLTTNAFSPVGKEKEEVKVNAFQGWGPEFGHITSIGIPLTITLSHGLSTLEGGLNMLFLQRAKDKVAVDGLTEEEEKGTVDTHLSPSQTLLCSEHLMGLIFLRNSSGLPLWTPEITKSS